MGIDKAESVVWWFYKHILKSYNLRFKIKCRFRITAYVLAVPYILTLNKESLNFGSKGKYKKRNIIVKYSFYISQKVK